MQKHILCEQLMCMKRHPIFPKQPQVRFSGTERKLIKSQTRLFIFANYYFILVSFSVTFVSFV